MQETTNIIGMKENYRLKLEQQVRENEAEMYKLKSEIEEKIATIKSYKYQLESQNKDHSEQMNNLNQQVHSIFLFILRGIDYLFTRTNQ